jgi:hypothetical protein
VVPVSVCVAVLFYDGWFYFFDSHGEKGCDYCELMRFERPIDLSQHLITKYSIECFARIDPSYKEMCSESELMAYYGYHANIFT